MKEKYLSLLKIFFPLLLGVIVGFLIKGSMDYEDLQKPFLSPNAIVFPIVWSILYIIIGLAYYLAQKDSEDPETKKIYYIHLFLNILWSFLFFTLKWRFFSILWIIAMIFTLILLMKKYYSQNKISFYLMIPYLLWLLFATYLNIGVYLLN